VRGPLVIFERSGCSDKAAEDWKKANVTPVFKKGNEEDPGRYRATTGSS